MNRQSIEITPCPYPGHGIDPRIKSAMEACQRAGIPESAFKQFLESVSGNRARYAHLEPEELFVGHSYDGYYSHGAYVIKGIRASLSISPKILKARSDWQVQLAGILQALKLPLGDGNVVIYSSDGSLMSHLGGESLWSWRDRGWRRSNGEPVQHSGLLAQISDKMLERPIAFACNRKAQMQKAAQAEAHAALREWRDSNSGRINRW